MTFETIHSTIEQEFFDNWDETAIPIIVDNKKTPTKKGTRAASLNEFVKLSIFTSSTEQAEIQILPGKRVEGFVQVSHFLKANKGARLNWRALDTARLIFELKTVSGITFRAANPTVIGEDEGFHQILIRIPFFTYEANGV